MEKPLIKAPTFYVNTRTEAHQVYRARLSKFIRSMGLFPDDIPSLIYKKRLQEREEADDATVLKLFFVATTGNEIPIVTVIF